ncbi:mucin-3B-like [Bufo gargarizans]|uniref:mucin-3B-like n=1 Tax=Bufo gargarizans TaxID=30331 RepID=UPI001CF2BE60|nr:mucin-3B-like [Bufo gargarizans]
MSLSFAGILCFNLSRAVISDQMDVKDLCSELETIPTELHPFFSGIITVSNQFLCVTNCSLESPHVIDCNNGQCLVSNKGPNCYCASSSQFWYTGDQCQVAVSKPGIYGSVASILTLLLIIIFLLAFSLYRRQRNRDNQNLIDPERNYQEDDWDFTVQDTVIVNASCVLETSSESDAASITLPTLGSPFRSQSSRPGKQNCP